VNTTLAKLDRIFVSTDWKSAFSLVRVSTLAKCISDYNPLLLDSGGSSFYSKKKFRFKKWWLERFDFKDLVLKAWSSECSMRDPMDVWQFKIRTFIRLVRRWANNVVAKMNKIEKPSG
jgi:hypothetical protein